MHCRLEKDGLSIVLSRGKTKGIMSVFQLTGHQKLISGLMLNLLHGPLAGLYFRKCIKRSWSTWKPSLVSRVTGRQSRH